MAAPTVTPGVIAGLMALSETEINTDELIGLEDITEHEPIYVPGESEKILEDISDVPIMDNYDKIIEEDTEETNENQSTES